jgi:tetratricopeptide (TPR) repeat protein
MQCLEKEPSGRYQTPNDLKLDIERHLRHETVLARPPSVVYTVRKFARRHKVVFAASLVALAFVAFLVSFAITLARQSQRIISERDRAEGAGQQAEQVSGVILEVLSAIDPFDSLAYDISGSEVLDQAARTIQGKLGIGTEARAKLLEGVGRAYRRRGESDKAVLFLSSAAEAWSQFETGDKSAQVGAMVEFSIAQRMSGDLQSAQETIEEAHELARQHGLEQSMVYAKLLLNRARNNIGASNLPQARKDIQASLQLSREHAGPNSKEVADALLTESTLFQWTDDFPEAERAAREALRIFETTVAPLYPDRVLAQTRLAEVLYLRHRVRAAELLFVESLRKNTQLFGENSWPVADVLDSLAMVRRSQGRLDEAEAFARRAVTSQSAASGEGHPNTTYLRTSLAALLIRRGKYAEAERELRRALVAHQSTVRPASDHYMQYVASAEYLLGEVLLATDRLSEAEDVLTASIERWQRSGAPPWRAARSASALGEALYRQGRVREAEMHLLKSNRELVVAPGADIEAKIKASERVARFLQRSGHATARAGSLRSDRELTNE